MAKNYPRSHSSSPVDARPDIDAKTEESGPAVDTQTGETEAPSPHVPMMEQVHLPKKIVAKDIVGRKEMVYKKSVILGPDGKALLNADGSERREVVDSEPRMLYRVFGTAQGMMTGESSYGPWVGFTGAFEAIRFGDRARFKSMKLFLQDPAEGLLMAALASVQKDNPSATVEFAFDIGVKVSQRWIDTDLGNTYEYTVQSVLSTQQSDPLAALRAQVSQSLPALAAPSKGS